MTPNETEPSTTSIDTAGLDPSDSADARDGASEPIYVLHVDDEPEFADLVATFLERVDDRFVIHTRTAAEDALEALEEADYDCVVSDYDMPGTDGIEFLEAVRDHDADELVGTSWKRVVPEAERESLEAVVGELETASGGFHSIHEHVRADGERIICEWHNRVVTDDAGDVVARFTLFQDVTDREHQEATLRAREAEFRAITESATDAILTIDTDSVIRYANPSVERVFGYEPDELVGEPLTTLMPERLRDRHRQALERYLETGERRVPWEEIEMTGLHRDGHELDLRISFSELETRQGHRFTGIIRDATAGTALMER